MIRGTFLFLLALFAVGTTASMHVPTAQEISEDEQTLWSLENAYFTVIAQEDFGALERFYHADFIGWPSHSPEPVDRNVGRQSLEEQLANTEVLSVKLRPLAVVVHGDVAITHLFVDLQQQDSDTEVSSSSHRVTHTWLREGGTWKILGGMSAR